MRLDGRIFSYASAFSIRQLLEEGLPISRGNKCTKGTKERRKGVRDEGSEEIASRLISTG
jgi:hypothetical protein